MMHHTDGGTPILYPALKQFGVASEMSGLVQKWQPQSWWRPQWRSVGGAQSLSMSTSTMPYR